MDVLQRIFGKTKDDVEIEYHDDKPIFKATDICRVLGFEHVTDANSNFDSDESSGFKVGRDHKSMFFAEACLHRIAMLSTHASVRPFQKWVAGVVETIHKTGMYETGERRDQLKNMHEAKTHAALLSACELKNVIYFGKIADLDDGKVFLKIGCTGNIRQRTWDLRNKYGAFTVLRLFECQDHYGFERFLHQHVDIKRYSRPEYNGVVSLETYAMSNAQLETTIGIVTRTLGTYRKKTEKLRDIEDASDKEMSQQHAGEKRKKSESAAEQRESKRGHTTELGPKVQIYTEEGSLVKTFNQFVDARRELDGKTHRNGIIDACEKNFMYFGYRWMMLERTLADNTVQQLQPTVEHKPIRTGYVVELSPDETSIVKVYANFKEAAHLNGFLAIGAVQKKMNRGDHLNGNIIRPWSECSDVLQKRFSERGGVLPAKVVNGRHFGVLKVDPVTKDVVHEYATIAEAKTDIKCAVRTLKSAIAQGVPLRGHLWKYDK